MPVKLKILLFLLLSPLFLLSIIGYAIFTIFRRLVWRNGVNLKTARRLRNCLLRTQTWRWYHFGFVPWISLNSILYKFDCLNKRATGKDTTGKRGIEAFCAVREECERDSDFEGLCRLWRETEPVDLPSFVNRDLTFFNEREGMVLTDPAKVLIRYVVVMRTNDFLKLYHVMNSLARRHLAKLKKLHLMDSALVRHFVDNDRDEFICLRQRLLERMRRYAHNMIMFAANKDRNAAHAWHDVSKKIVHIEEMEPNDKNEATIRKDAEDLIEKMDRACGYTSVCMIELQRRTEMEECALCEGRGEVVKTTPAVAFEGVDYSDHISCLKWFDNHIGWKCQRFEIRKETSGNGFYIVDTLRQRGLKSASERKRWEYHGLTAAMKMRVILHLLEQLATKPGKPMESIKCEKWKSRFPSAEIYGQFKVDQIINLTNRNGTHSNKWRLLTDAEVRTAMAEKASGNKGGHKRA